MARTRNSRLGPAARPVAVPDDVADPALEKARGKVELLLNVRWSGHPKAYDLADRADRLRAYEQILREGTEENVRAFVDVDQLLELWDELVLPRTCVLRGPRGTGGIGVPTSRAECDPAPHRGDAHRPVRG